MRILGLVVLVLVTFNVGCNNKSKGRQFSKNGHMLISQ